MFVRIKVNGIVQGVGFRPFVYRIACNLGLKGYVLNLGDAGVEIEVEGGEERIEEFIHLLHEKKPPLARIDEVFVEKGEEKGYKKFEIRKSKDERRNGTSIIPPDISICDECIVDMVKQERRKNYFFVTCTNCGPRFTIIKHLPYDRPNTTMDEFEMCNDCKKEYTDALNRRYHAQTIACRNCGPEIFLQYENEEIKGEEAIWKAAELLNEGKVVAIKGIGGYHLSCIATEGGEAVGRLRNMLGRRQKPFAIMVKDIEMARDIAYVSREEEKILSSYVKPIVLLNKRKELKHVAPHLHNYGVMLPYTGIHIMLFKKVRHPLVMTSANYPGLPICHTEDEIEEMAADAILFYNRKIWQRCDDSIMRVVDGDALLIRRSRGFVPIPVKLHGGKASILATGAEENVTACLLKGENAFLTQHLGHVQHLETFEFFKEAVSHLSHLINFEAEAIACDLHPSFMTTKFAEEMADEKELPLFRIQHHHAHIAKAMSEYGLGEAIGIAIDGFGYGNDGMAWGGEILFCDVADFKRMAHLQYHPMPGGDAATKYPLRMVAGILGEKAMEFLMERSNAFPHGEEEIEVVLKMAKKGIKTSSCGRLLDAVAAMLDICHVMEYEGEPAMKLESMARDGKNVLEMEIERKGEEILTSGLLETIMEHLNTFSRKDLAYSAEHFIAEALATVAIEKAEEESVKNIVVAGGCAYNEHIVSCIKERVKAAGMNFFINRQVPCGDGGISFGQAAVANERIKKGW